MRIKDISINVKITALVVGVTFLALLLMFASLTWISSVRDRKHLVRNTTIAARMVAEYSVGSLAFSYEKEVKDTLRKLSFLEYINYAAIYDGEGNLFADYGSNKKVKIPSEIITPLRPFAVFDSAKLTVCEPMIYKGNRFGTLCLNVSTKVLTQRISAYAKVMFVIVLVVGLLAFLLTSRLQYLVSKSLLNLAGTASKIAEKQDYSFRTGINQGDEIGVLAKSFDTMIINLGERVRERDAVMAELRKAHITLEEKVKKRTSELSMLNRELEAFTYSASHDLRAPLRRIDGFSVLLEENLEKCITDDGRKYLSRMRAGCQEMSGVIDSLLKLSQITRHEIKFTSVNLSAIAKLILHRLSESEPSKKVDIVVAENLKDTGDLSLLEDVFENILGNAWKFTAKTEKAKIEFGEMEVEKGIKAYFIKDNGAGFDMAYKAKLFKPFQRIHSASQYSGTGIGLSTVQRIIERHGGRIWAQGKEGEGSVFYFTLGESSIKAVSDIKKEEDTNP
ncbi:MAG: ATP-binding protein [Elusimicrobiota bacterium]|nr:ATP-binding protein [Elusimicrobiota bacterium]